jgi:hypothetical protein
MQSSNIILNTQEIVLNASSLDERTLGLGDNSAHEGIKP